jgi:hypothetical protein
MKLTPRRTVRRLPLTAAAGLAVVLAATGCDGTATIPTGSAPTSVAPFATTPATPATPAPPRVAIPPPSIAPTPRTTTQPVPRVHFTTPQGAMRYLAAAYNRDDLPALKKVTTASARSALTAMRQEATNLALTSCSRRASGDYVCQFRHDYPSRLHRSGHGHATFLAGPADTPGWYMTLLIDSG